MGVRHLRAHRLVERIDRGPVITTQPANQTVNLGATATFSVAATGTAPLSYQWYQGSTAISGATSASYTTPPTTAADNGATFHVVVTNAAGSATSNATLTVNNPATAPAITMQPASQTVGVGATATFTVAATGSAPLSYQWSRAAPPSAAPPRPATRRRPPPPQAAAPPTTWW